MDTLHENHQGIGEYVHCNLCNANDFIILFEAGKAQSAQIVKCKECGLIYANPRHGLVDSDIHEGHEPQGWLKGVATDPNHTWRWRYQKEKGQVQDFAKTRKILNRLYPEGGTMIEVGSGLGYLLRSFKDAGWQVLGVDPWRELPLATQELHDIETIPQTLEKAALPDASADVIVMLHVIEHVPNPMATLREIYRVLKPGGHAVIETPRYDTLMFRLLRHRERSLRCEGHVYFYTFKTLRRTYEKAGFTQVDTRAVGRTLSLERFMWNIGTISGNQKARNVLVTASKKAGFEKVKFTLNLRDMQRVVIKKAEA